MRALFSRPMGQKCPVGALQKKAISFQSGRAKFFDVSNCGLLFLSYTPAVDISDASRPVWNSQGTGIKYILWARLRQARP